MRYLMILAFCMLFSGALSAAESPVDAQGLTFSGWAMMLVSTIGMTVFFGLCIWKVMTTPGEVEHLHSTADIDPHDQED